MSVWRSRALAGLITRQETPSYSFQRRPAQPREGRLPAPKHLQAHGMVSSADKALVGPFTLKEWEDFLGSDPPDDGVRLLLRKSKSTAPGIDYVEARDAALCFGWVDSTARSHDGEYQQRCFTPRRARSRWSQVNREVVERLTAEGRMREGGLAEVDRAKADGRWDAAYRMRTAEPDGEFRAALDANARARDFWETLGRTKRFPFLFRLMNIKRPETKTKKIELFIQTLERHETLKP